MNEGNEAISLLLQPLRQFVVGQLAVNKLFVAVADEQPPRKDVGIAVASDLLEMLNGAQALELTRSQSDERTGAAALPDSCRCILE